MESRSRRQSTYSVTTANLYSYSSFFSQRKNRAVSPARFLLPFESSELLQRRRSKVRIEPLAVDRNRLELCQVRSRGNFVILISLIPLQLPQFHLFRVVFQEIGIVHCILRRHQDHVHIRPVRSLEIGQPQYESAVRQRLRPAKQTGCTAPSTRLLSTYIPPPVLGLLPTEQVS